MLALRVCWRAGAATPDVSPRPRKVSPSRSEAVMAIWSRREPGTQEETCLWGSRHGASAKVKTWTGCANCSGKARPCNLRSTSRSAAIGVTGPARSPFGNPSSYSTSSVISCGKCHGKGWVIVRRDADEVGGGPGLHPSATTDSQPVAVGSPTAETGSQSDLPDVPNAESAPAMLDAPNPSQAATRDWRLLDTGLSELPLAPSLAGKRVPAGGHGRHFECLSEAEDGISVALGNSRSYSHIARE